jgi:hypothetical protein
MFGPQMVALSWEVVETGRWGLAGGSSSLGVYNPWTLVILSSCCSSRSEEQNAASAYASMIVYPNI